MSDKLTGDWIVEMSPRSKKLLLALLKQHRNRLRQKLVDPKLTNVERGDLEPEFVHVERLITSVWEAKTYD